MTHIEAMKIEALAQPIIESYPEKDNSQPEQEPVKWVDYELDGVHHTTPPSMKCEGPQQRTWVGLDEEDDIDWEDGGSLRDLVEAVEARLKELNT